MCKRCDIYTHTSTDGSKQESQSATHRNDKFSLMWFNIEAMDVYNVDECSGRQFT